MQEQHHMEKFWKIGMLTFVSGTVVMALEIATSRVITPVFGSTTYTWGSLIGIILSGLSLGYFLGGRLADSNPNFAKISGITFAVGIYILLMPFMMADTVEVATNTLPDSIYAPLLASFLLLIIPSILLGFVSPYGVKLATKTLQKVGNSSGNLYALATIGSILGTFLTVFVLIPNFEVNQIIFALGIALMLCSLLGLGKISKIMTVAAIMVLATPWSELSIHVTPHYGNLVYQEETPFSHLDVVELGDRRSMYLNGIQHSSMSISDPTKLIIDYTEYFHLGKIYNPEFQNVLFVGGGGFTGPKNFLDVYPDVKIDVAEIDPNVIQIARTYFELEESSNLVVHNEDARVFLNSVDKEYDVIILDAYATNYIPYHLMTQEFFQLVNEKITPNGVVIMNVIASIDNPKSDLFRAIYKTMDSEFTDLDIFPTEQASNVQNILIVATNNPEQLKRTELLQIAEAYSVPYIQDELSKEMHFYEGHVQTNDVPLFTDQFNPVNSMINPLTNQIYAKERFVDKKESEDPLNVFAVVILVTILIVWNIQLRKTWNVQNIRI